MSTNTATAKHRHHHKDKSSTATIEFKADAVVEGKVPIKPQDEVDIQSAREVLDMRTRKNLGKSHKVKVIGTDTRIIIKRKSVVSSGPREISLLCNEVYRFFIFTRDPKLVILVIPDPPEGNRAYLLLKMKSQADANAVCNVIQSGRKKLSSQSALQPETAKSPGQGRTSESAPPEEAEVEMQENGKSVDKPASYEVETESSHSEDEHEDVESNAGSASTPKKSTRTTTPEVPSPKISEPAIEVKPEEEHIELAATSQVHSAFPGMMEHEINVNSAVKSDLDKEDTSPRSLPRTPLHTSPLATRPKKEKKSRPHREPPLTEEMYVEPPKNWKVAQPIYARREEELRQALLVDMYDDDWAVDVKLIKSDGSFGSHISDTGNVYMFTAHHLVPENYNYFECSSSSDEEVELKEKPPLKMNNGLMRRNSSSSESEPRNGYAGMNRA
ncbi:hypothetical protein Aperf_G00000026007 [Anoplocephala perfoliata]